MLFDDLYGLNFYGWIQPFLSAMILFYQYYQLT